MNRKYTKSHLESIVYRQLENLDAMGEKIKLLEKQNELLMKLNNKLQEELSEQTPCIPYPKVSRKRDGSQLQRLAAESGVTQFKQTKKGA
jgi:hypothetical protein